MTSAIFELAAITIAATLLGFLARFLKQPVILAYIFTGIIIGLTGASHFVNKEIFQTFSELGVMFLLFLIGMEINYASLRLVGRTSLIVGLAQVFFTALIGFSISLFFNFNYIESAYIGAALTFSSTIIVVKLLSEKKDLGSLYGKISVGLLLVQDALAILILIFLTGLKTQNNSLLNEIVVAFFKAAILIGIMFWLGRKILPLAFHKIARSQELLFLASLAWCLGVAAVVQKIGFSVEIGGFLAGLALANSSEYFQISAKIKSLRDFFILIFFVILGSSLTLANISGLIFPLVVFSLFVLIGNPLIVLLIMGFLGYKKRTSFLCGATIAQISEFSLILVTLGFELGHLTPEVVSLITGVGITTITLSTYLIIYNEEIYRYLSRYLAVFEHKNKKEESVSAQEFNKPVILVGSHRVGLNIAANLPKEDLLIIDFDPDVIRQLARHGYASLFGDISDADIVEKSNLKNSKLVISTSPDFEDNLRILNEVKSLENKPKVIVRAENEDDAKTFYAEGADYVILPHFTSGQYLGRSIAVDSEFKILNQLKNKDLELMTKLNKESI